MVSHSRRSRDDRLLPTVSPPATVLPAQNFETQLPAVSTTTTVTTTAATARVSGDLEQKPHNSSVPRCCLCLRLRNSTTARGELADRATATAYYYGHDRGAEEREEEGPGGGVFALPMLSMSLSAPCPPPHH